MNGELATGPVARPRSTDKAALNQLDPVATARGSVIVWSRL